MSGYFDNAPLSYVEIKIDTTEFPPLLKEQLISLRQAMLNINLVHFERSKGKEFQINPNTAESKELSFSDSPRIGFLDSARSNCFIVDRHSLVWKTTNYTKYKDFFVQFIDVFTTFMKAVPEVGNVEVRQTSLAYVDVIIPNEKYQLKDYFHKPTLLPLSSLEDHHDDLLQLGRLDVTRVKSRTEKINISLEELPQKAGKFLPDALNEAEECFKMPINLPSLPDPKSVKTYALLMTQASTLITVNLKQADLQKIYDILHTSTKEVFKSIIDFDTCSECWGYRDEDGEQ